MARQPQAVVDLEHGEQCTCTMLDPIELTAQPVLVNRDCPGQRDVPRKQKIDGRVIITWPSANGPAIHGWGVAVADADTGESWANVLNLRIIAEPREIATAIVERMVDQAGAPTNTPVPGEGGDRFRTALFRYAVAEMRVAESADA